MISEQDYIKAAKRIGCEIESIKAVDAIESRGSGFLTNGDPKILFEPHIFFKELKKKYGKDPKITDICYPVWGTKPYGSVSIQHKRLQEAIKIDRECALKSASWGRFQILGNNYKSCDCNNLQEFINKIYKSEADHLDLFVSFIINENLEDELIHKNWKGFAASYNGKFYYKNAYDKKLKEAYEKFKK